MLHISSSLHGFRNISTTTREAKSGRTVFCLEGEVEIPEEERSCACGCHMHIHNNRPLTLRHLCIGGNLSCVTFPHYQLRCPKCEATNMHYISFMAPGHRITAEMYQYARDLLARGTYTNKQIAEITGLGRL